MIVSVLQCSLWSVENRRDLKEMCNKTFSFDANFFFFKEMFALAPQTYLEAKTILHLVMCTPS